jgi:phospholipase/carboxylesterase
VSLRALERPAAGEPEGALVLLHGRGADENDLLPLLDALDPERRLHGYTPRAPLALPPPGAKPPKSDAPGGADVDHRLSSMSAPPGGAHWYAVPRVGYPDPETFRQGYAALTEWFDALPFPAERIALGGFSQGAVMSYALGLGQERPRTAALLAMSGFIPTVEGWEPDLSPPFPPIAIRHGTYDPVISVEFARQARATLEAAGATVDYGESPIEHWIDPAWIAELRPLVAQPATK